jgi:hypothetical protein
MLNPKTLLANLKKAKFDREKLEIGGGIFDAGEVYDLILELCKDVALLNYLQDNTTKQRDH